MSMEALARAVGVTDGAVWRWERRGQAEAIGSVLLHLADALGVEPRELYTPIETASPAEPNGIAA
jgi:transcriptional regulator with XRE-family HTH domain